MLPSIVDLPADRPLVIRYHRLSREEQAEGHGLARQQEGTAGWCGRRRVDADVVLEDIGYSAFTADHIRRGRMGQILDAIASGRIAVGSTLVIENLDRLSRQSPLEAIKTFTNIVSGGITIVTVCDDYHYTQDGSAMQKMITMIMSIMHFGRANSESEIKSIRVAQAWREKHRLARESRVPHGRRCPEWIELTSTGYELIETRAAEVRQMFTRTIDGWGRRRIVKDLIARGVEPWVLPTRKRPRPVWNESYVQKILSSGEACGTYFPRRQSVRRGGPSETPIEDYYPAAVDRETFGRARAAADERRGAGGRKGSFKNMFQNLCVCGSCGKGMTLENKGARSRRSALVCQRALVGGCDHRLRYVYYRAELMIMHCLGEHADALLRSADVESRNVCDSISVKEIRLRDVEDRIRRLVKRMETLDDEALDDALRNLRSEHQSLRAEISALRNSLSRLVDVGGVSSPIRVVSFFRRLNSFPAEERPLARNKVNQELRSIVKKILFVDGKFTVEFFNGGKGFGFMLPGNRLGRNSDRITSNTKDGIELRKERIPKNDC